MPEPSAFEAVLARDRLIVILGLVTVIVLAWIYLLHGAGMDMSAMDMARHDHGMSVQQDMGEARRMAHAAMLHSAVWTPPYAGLMVVMWWVMMVAMMLPS